MNRLRGNISQINTSGNITLVEVDAGRTSMASVIIGALPMGGSLQHGDDIELLFNESEVSIGRIADGQISLSNQLPCVVETLIPGEILSQVLLSFGGERLTALITTRSARRLNLKPGDPVTAFIKATEVLLKEPDEAENAH